MAEVKYGWAQNVDSKKTEFKNYLEKTGAVDQLTKVLVQLYEENDKPSNVEAVDYVRRFLGGGGDVDAERLQKQYEDAQEENERLKKQI